MTTFDKTVIVSTPWVVNCFQNCTLWYTKQQIQNTGINCNERCCELLSKLYLCILNNLIVSYALTQGCRIAFKKLYLYIVYTTKNHLELVAFVVNCFQNCIFDMSITTQLYVCNPINPCCELLSKIVSLYSKQGW